QQGLAVGVKRGRDGVGLGLVLALGYFVAEAFELGLELGVAARGGRELLLADGLRPQPLGGAGVALLAQGPVGREAGVQLERVARDLALDLDEAVLEARLADELPDLVPADAPECGLRELRLGLRGPDAVGELGPLRGVLAVGGHALVLAEELLVEDLCVGAL